MSQRTDIAPAVRRIPPVLLVPAITAVAILLETHSRIGRKLRRAGKRQPARLPT